MSAPVEEAAPRSAVWWERAQIALRGGLATVLGFQAGAFLLVGKRGFERLGYPDSARIALAVLELASAILTVIPRTFFVGAVGLIATLSWAAGFHFALRARNWPLIAGAVVLAALLAARARADGARRRRAA